MNYDQKIKQELEHIPESKKEQLYQIVRTFRRQNETNSGVNEETIKYNTNTALSQQESDEWERIIDESTYLALLKVRDILKEGKVNESIYGMEKIIEAETAKEQDELLKQLAELMKHIFIWFQGYNYRTEDRVHEIFRAREEIEIRKEPAGTDLDDEYLKSIWNKAQEEALEYAKNELQENPVKQTLNWQEVFDTNYPAEAN